MGIFYFTVAIPNGGGQPNSSGAGIAKTTAADCGIAGGLYHDWRIDWHSIKHQSDFELLAKPNWDDHGGSNGKWATQWSMQ